MKKEFAVIGLGRFGGSIVQELADLDCDVLAIDSDEERVNKFLDIATESVIADTTDEQVIKDLGLKNFDNIIVSIGDNIQASILTTLLLKDLGVERVTVKAQSNYHARVLEKIGADLVVRPERDMGRRIAHQLNSTSVLDYFEVGDDYSIVEYFAGEEHHGRTLIDLDIRDIYGISVVAIKRGDKIIVSPAADEEIDKDDVLITIGDHDAQSNYERRMKR